MDRFEVRMDDPGLRDRINVVSQSEREEVIHRRLDQVVRRRDVGSQFRIRAADPAELVSVFANVMILNGRAVAHEARVPSLQ